MSHVMHWTYTGLARLNLFPSGVESLGSREKLDVRQCCARQILSRWGGVLLFYLLCPACSFSSVRCRAAAWLGRATRCGALYIKT